MTTSDLIRLLEKHEYGISGRAREVNISISDESGNHQTILNSENTLIVTDLDDGIAGSELGLLIVKK